MAPLVRRSPLPFPQSAHADARATLSQEALK